ncbi:MAG: SusC/RagA family TonB-linked outer membrane protein [Niabella sp.]
MKKAILIIIACSCFNMVYCQKNSTITGIVFDADTKQVIAGVNIESKESNKTTISNGHGGFTLNIPWENDSLLISVAGYISQIIPANDSLKIYLLPDIWSMESVTINTGYQKLKPNELLGSISLVDNVALNRQVGANILDRLNGAVPGLYFNIGKSGNNSTDSKTNISIRGLSTINGPLDPLIVLDNFIYEGDISNINPNDIENVSVLKDAAATSIYGARGGNGVIVITTRKGRFNQQAQVQFSAMVTVADKPDLFYLPQMSSAEYISVESYLFNKGYFDNDINNARTPLTPAVKIFADHRAGLISSSDSATLIAELKNIDKRNELLRYAYKRALQQQYAINVRGGNQNLAWIAGGDYNRAYSNLNDPSDKINFRFENTYRPVKRVELSTGVYFSHASSNTGTSGYNLTIGGRDVPYISLQDATGNLLPVDIVYRSSYTDTLGKGLLQNWKYYPLQDYLEDRTKLVTEEYVAKASLMYNITEWIKVGATYQYQKQQENIERNADSSSYYTRDLINRFSQVNYSANTVNYIVPTGGILNQGQTYTVSNNLRLHYELKKARGQHTISSIGGFETRQVEIYGSGQTLYGYTHNPLSYSTVDNVHSYPNIITGNYEYIPGGGYVLSEKTTRFVSAYINIAYQFKQRYLLSVSARKDGSNIFGLKTNDKWKPLWSATGGWVISKEDFFNSSLLTLLRLRIGYGVSGNVDVSRIPVPTAVYGSNQSTGFNYARIITINNPSLRWEQNGQLNIGADFSLVRDRISGVLEYYRKKGSDLYGETPYDYTSWGYSTQIVKNVAAMKGDGIDFTLNTINLLKPVKWMTTFLFSYNNSRTTKYYSENAINVFYQLGAENIITPVVGKPLYSVVAYKWAGLDANGNPQGILNGEPSIDYAAITDDAKAKGQASSALIYMGSSTPTIFGAFTNELVWNRISLSFNMVYKLGYYFRRSSINYGALITEGAGHGDYSKRWQQPGDEKTTNVPSFVYTDYPQFDNRNNFYRLASINVLKADHIRFQYVNMGYSLPVKFSKYFSALQLNMNIANIGVLWTANKEHLDPEYPNVVPPSRSYTFGIKASF